MMNSKIKKTFDTIKLSDESDAEIKALLTAKLYENENKNEMENLTMIKPKKYRLLLIATILSLGLVGFTFGTQAIKLLTGVNYERGKNFTSIEMGYENEPFEIREDKVFFVLNEENIDITNQISEDDYYKYEYTDENGYKQIVIIGGSIEDVGFNIYLFDNNGISLASSGQYNPIDDNMTAPIWIQKADRELNKFR